MIRFREPNKRSELLVRTLVRDAHKARYSCMRARIVIMHRFRALRLDAAAPPPPLLITIRADCAKRDETGHTGATTARQNKGWMAQRGAGEAGATYMARAICGAKNESAKRRAGAGKGRRYEGEKEYETEQLKLGMVPTWAHTISAKSLLTLRDLLGAISAFLATFIWHKSEKGRERDRYVRIV